MMVKKSATVMFLFVGLFGIWMGGCETQEQKVERLIKQLGHKKVKVRVSAARTLGLGLIGEGAVDAVPALIKALQDPEVRWYAAGALGSIRSKDAVPSLIQVLQDKDEYVRGSGRAAWALGKIGSKDAVHALIQALEDQNSQVRGIAARALGSIGEGAIDAVPALIKALQNKDEHVRVDAEWALRQIQQKH